jgi:EpsI family protein
VSKIQLHAYALVIVVAIVLAGTKSVKPLTILGPPNTKFEKIPLKFDGWSGVDDKFDEITYKYLPSASLLLRHYEHDNWDAPVDLAIVYGTDLGDFHQPDVCLRGQGFNAISKGKVSIKGADGKPFEATTLLMEYDYGRQVFMYWFTSKHANDKFVGSYKLRILYDRLVKHSVTPSAMVRLSAPVIDSDEENLNELVKFAEAVAPYLSEQFASEGELDGASAANR